MSDRLLIVGASARAAAASARRAGLLPFAVDQFADRDTQALCGWAERYSPRVLGSLFSQVRWMPPMPWLYTGGLENDPDLITGMSAERELWGNDADALRSSRQPEELAGWLWRDGWRFAESGDRPGPGRWLRKPRRSGGGLGIRDATPADGPAPGLYFQRFVPGRSMSALVATAPGACEVLAVTTQLVGRPWLHAGPFAYCGSLTRPGSDPGPAVVGVARDLADRCGLQGLWGFDFVEEPGGSRVVVEVNPRYPASAEVVELATRCPLLTWHRWGCEVGDEPAPPRPATHVVGKAVYYAARPLTVPQSGPWDESLRHCTDVWRRPDFADIPRPGPVHAGEPVITLLAEAATEAACLATLKARAAELDQLFGVFAPEDRP